jgi:hypothetical protein
MVATTQFDRSSGLLVVNEIIVFKKESTSVIIQKAVSRFHSRLKYLSNLPMHSDVASNRRRQKVFGVASNRRRQKVLNRKQKDVLSREGCQNLVRRRPFVIEMLPPRGDRDVC